MAHANGVIFQSFHWYAPDNGTFWNHLAARAPDLAGAGFSAVWFPPAHKGTGGARDVGYGVYDLFDLGEFDQKSSVRTKYGTKAQLLAAVGAAHAAGMQAYGDVVFNHKDGGDVAERCWAQRVHWDNRNEPAGPWQEEAFYTGFTFPGRGDAYSDMKWHWWHFDAVSHNAITGNAHQLYRLKDKHFETDVSLEHGNYDYLMACDLDTREPQVDGELRYWGRWFVDVTGVDGFRIDAVKHVRAAFFRDWVNHLRGHFGGRELFSVGEYWSGDGGELEGYLARSGGVMSLFDVPLHYRFRDASLAGANYDLRTIFDGTLVRRNPMKAVTFVENHDSQPCQSLESPVEPWFKPLAYALILLRRDGYPCVFQADYDGAEYDNCRGGYPVVLYSHRHLIDRFLRARREYGFGDQHDYFDHPNTVGWFRTGDGQHPGAMAVLMTNGAPGDKWMNVFRPGAAFRDATGHFGHEVRANGDGWANFQCPGGSVSVWVTT